MEIDLSHDTQLYVGLWERETHPFLRRAAERCAWAIDVGAGRGELCLYLLRRPSVRQLYAFEPQASEVAWLQRNLRLNNLEGNRQLSVLTRFAGCGPAETSTPLDALDVDRAQRGFIKIDVDGAEMDVLGSGANLFSETPIDLLLETHSQQLERECLAFLSAKGFNCQLIKNAWWRAIVPEMRPIEHNRWLWATKD